MTFVMIGILALLLTCHSSSAKSLTDDTALCPGDSQQFSGYLNAGQGVEYFYYLTMSRSAQPLTDPLILWMTGGPGCSSMLAFIAENGPCVLDMPPPWDASRATSGLAVRRNPWSWTEAANVLWVDQPISVGFSSIGGQMPHNEVQVTNLLVPALQDFYAQYPQFLDLPLYIMGESYGGHYVPALANRILQLGSQSGVGVVAGIALGNAVVDPALQLKSNPTMAYTGGKGGSLGHGVVDDQVHQQMRDKMSKCQSGIEACKQAKQNNDHKLGDLCAKAYQFCIQSEDTPVVATNKNPYDLRKTCIPNTPFNICYDFSPETAFLNQPRVKKDIGVPSDRSWQICNLTALYPFIVSGDELISFRKSVAKLLDAGIRVLVFAGDTDAMVNWIGCKAWMQDLEWKHQQEWNDAPNVDFLVQARIRGSNQSARGLTFLQVYDAGHMVPMDQPQAALAMVQAFLGEVPSVPVLGKPERSHADLPMNFTEVVFVALLLIITAALACSCVRRKLRARELPETAYYLFT